MSNPTPAPAPTAAQFANPLTIIGPEYCAPNPVDLLVVKKVWTISNGDFVITDSIGTPIFEVERNALTLHDQRILRDADGNPIVTLRQQRMTLHHRWNVYMGESKEPDDLIFTIKRSEMIQPIKDKLQVFLANNMTKEEVCDFMVEGSWAGKTCVVYTGDRTNILAQMGKKIGAGSGSVLIGEDSVSVQPNVDYAFIVALIVILEDMNHMNERAKLAFSCAITGTTLAGALFGGN